MRQNLLVFHFLTLEKDEKRWGFFCTLMLGVICFNSSRASEFTNIHEIMAKILIMLNSVGSLGTEPC